MHEATEARMGGFLALLVGFALAAGGCGPSANPDVKVDKDKSNPKQKDSERPAPEPFVHGFLQALTAGKADPNVLTVSFMKKIARPRDGDAKDKELGYNPNKVEDYLKTMGQGKYDDGLTLIGLAAGPFIYGRVTNQAGATEGFVLRLVPAENTWKIDLFYRSRFATGAYSVDNPGPDLIGAKLAAQCFIENLLGGEPLLAEALLAQSWKETKYWSEDPEGYSHALVQQKLAGWRGNYSEYHFVDRKVSPGEPAKFEIVAQTADKKTSKKFTLTVKKEANGEWLVDKIEVEPVKP